MSNRGEPNRGESDDVLLEIGRVTRPHGVRGEVKVQLHWQGSDALFDVERVVVRRAGTQDQWFDVVQARRANKFVLLALGGCESMEAAEALRDSVLLVSRAQLPALEPGEYYLADLVGMSVKHGGDTLGIVSEVRPYATVDAVVIETPEGGQVEQPMLDHWIERVDLDARTITLATRDGLIE